MRASEGTTGVATADLTGNRRFRAPSVEVELVVTCARTRLSPPDTERIRRLLDAGPDWSQVFIQAARHQTLPLLFRSLVAASDRIPAAVLEPLRQQADARARRNRELAQALLEFVALLRAHDIRVLPFKGPVLAVQAYGDLAPRHFLDLDLLHFPEDTLRIRDLLRARGYTVTPDLAGARARCYIRSECHWGISSPDGKVLFETHWSAREQCLSFDLPVAELWQRRTEVELLGERIASLGPEDLLLVLSVHGAKHSWDRLKWICDIAELLASGPHFDWGVLLDRAGRLGAERMLLVALGLAERVFDAELPVAVSDRIATSPALEPLLADLIHRLFAPFNEDTEALESAALYLSMRERKRDRLQYLLTQFFTPTMADWESLPLPDPLFAAYYALRPCRLSLRYGSRLLQRLTRRRGEAALT